MIAISTLLSHILYNKRLAFKHAFKFIRREITGRWRHLQVKTSWNLMAHAQKPDLVFRAKRTSPFKSAGGRQFSRILRSRVVRISGSNAGYTVFRGSVKGTGYPLHSPVSLFTFPPVRHRVPSHFNWTLQRFNPLKPNDPYRGRTAPLTSKRCILCLFNKYRYCIF